MTELVLFLVVALLLRAYYHYLADCAYYRQAAKKEKR